MCAQATTIVKEQHSSRLPSLDFYRHQLTLQAEKTNEQLRQLLERLDRQDTPLYTTTQEHGRYGEHGVDPLESTSIPLSSSSS